MCAYVCDGGSFIDSTFTRDEPTRQMIAFALNRRIGNEVVQMRVVAQSRRFENRWIEIDKAAKEAKCLGLCQPPQMHVTQLRSEGIGHLGNRGRGGIELRLQQHEAPAHRESIL